jgi:hypothetical protein
MRYVPTTVKLNPEARVWHQLYLARGRDHAGNDYGNPAKAAAELIEARKRNWNRKQGH